MAIKSLNPYFYFNGTASKAIQFYETALGAKTESKSLYGDLPGNKLCEGDQGRVMHAQLRLGDNLIMISDARSTHPVPLDTNTQVAVHFDDEADMTQKFHALAEGGNVTMPLDNTFWGGKFGMLIDAYGIHWMFNYEHKKS